MKKQKYRELTAIRFLVQRFRNLLVDQQPLPSFPRALLKLILQLRQELIFQRLLLLLFEFEDKLQLLLLLPVLSSEYLRFASHRSKE